MNVSGTNSMQQMQQQQQMHMRKMDGSGGGQGQGGGMKDIMQSLSADDQTALKDQMSSLSQTDRKAAMEQMKEVDPTSTDYSQQISDIMSQFTDPTQSTDILAASGATFSAYA